MVDIILIVFLALRNSARAKLRGQNPLVWGLITVGATLGAYIIGGFFVIFAFCKDVVNMTLASPGAARSEAMQQQLQQAILTNPLHFITIELFGIGGYLLVRYKIDSKHNKKKPEIHWMDKMGQQESEK